MSVQLTTGKQVVNLTDASAMALKLTCALTRQNSSSVITMAVQLYSALLSHDPNLRISVPTGWFRAMVISSINSNPILDDETSVEPARPRTNPTEFELSDAGIETLRQSVEDGGDTATDTINRAIQLFAFIVATVRKIPHKVYVLDGDQIVAEIDIEVLVR